MDNFLLRLTTVIVLFQVFTCERSIKLLGILPMSGSGWVGGVGCALPSKLAVDDINANPNILPGYNLSYTYIDSKVNMHCCTIQNFFV